MEKIEQEMFLNDTLVLAGFDPQVDDFETLKEDMYPILDEFLELHLYNLLNPKDKELYDKSNNKNMDFFAKHIYNFDQVLAGLYSRWQDEYVRMIKED